MVAPRRSWWFIAAVGGAIGLLSWMGVSQSRPAHERMHTVFEAGLVLPKLPDHEAQVLDPVVPERPAVLVGERDADFQGVSGEPGSVPDTLLPEEADRVQKTARERGGIDPCQSPDPGFGIFDKWRWGGGAGKLLVPAEELRDVGSADTVFHFAGYELARKEVARSDAPVVFLGVAFPSGGLNYRRNLSGPTGLTALENAVRASLKRVPDVPSKLGHVALASWSAGYDGVGVILQQSKNAGDVDAVILLDGLHASRKDEMAELQLAPFVEFAKRAARGEAFMFVSYSSVPTDGYASTHETGRRLIRELGGEPLFVRRNDPGGLELKEMFSKGSFHARGYRGGGELDHCAHLMLYPMALAALERRWHG